MHPFFEGCAPVFFQTTLHPIFHGFDIVQSGLFDFFDALGIVDPKGTKALVKILTDLGIHDGTSHQVGIAEGLQIQPFNQNPVFEKGPFRKVIPQNGGLALVPSIQRRQGGQGKGVRGHQGWVFRITLQK